MSNINEINSTESDYLCTFYNDNPQIPNDDIVEILQNVFDPDIHYSVYDIGLIYKVFVDNSKLDVIMTLTSVNCPEAQSLPEEIKTSLETKFPQLIVSVEIVFEPMWTVDNMSDEIKLSLGLL